MRARSYKRFDSKEFIKDIEDAHWSVCSVFDDPDDCYWAWCRLFNSVCQRHAPHRIIISSMPQNLRIEVEDA